MSTHTRQPADDTASIQLAEELEAVRDQMVKSVSDLNGPFRVLVQSSIRSAGPPHRAALVLCAGYTGPEGDPQRRILLAAALEMLHVALSIHQLLVDSPTSSYPAQPAEEQRSYIGSAILAGDYCFSRAAQMAAGTENPAIVSLFASALQDVSQSRLRELLSGNDGSQTARGDNHDEILLRSGATAALELTDLPAQDRIAVLNMSQSTIDSMLSADTSQDSSASHWGDLPGDIPAAYRARWQALHWWLASGSEISHPSR